MSEHPRGDNAADCDPRGDRGPRGLGVAEGAGVAGDAAERAHGALFGFVLGSGFGVAGQGRRLTVTPAPVRPARGVTPPATAGPRLTPEEVRPAARAVSDAGRSLLASPADPGPSMWVGQPYAFAVALGVATTADPVELLVEKVQARIGGEEAPSDVTSAVSAVATAVSVLVAGGNWEEAFALALSAADDGASRGVYVPGPQLSARIGWAQALAARAEGDPVEVIDLLVGAGAPPQETVPAAFALATLHRDDPVAVAESARRLGGCSTAIAGIATALVGVDAPRRTWPVDLVEVGESFAELEVLAEALAAER